MGTDETGFPTDKAVAEAIGMGWCGGNPIPHYDGRWPWPPPFTTDIAAAWVVMDRMHALGWLFHVNAMCDGFVVNGRYYEVPNGRWREAQLTNLFVQECGDTAPEAICRAALKAIEEEKKCPKA